MKTLLSLIFSSALLLGCATHGNRAIKDETQESVDRAITVDRSTKTEVRMAYGSPANVAFTDSGNEVWNYEFSRVRVNGKSFIPIVGIFAGGTNTKKKQLVIFFDAKGIVRKFSFEDSISAVRETEK